MGYINSLEGILSICSRQSSSNFHPKTGPQLLGLKHLWPFRVKVSGRISRISVFLLKFPLRKFAGHLTYPWKLTYPSNKMMVGRWKILTPFQGTNLSFFRVSGYHLKRRIFVWLLTMTPRWSPRAIDGDGVNIWEPDLDHGPPKPTYLEVFMVHGAWYLGGQNLYFSCFWGLMVYIYICINGLLMIYCV